MSILNMSSLFLRVVNKLQSKPLKLELCSFKSRNFTNTTNKKYETILYYNDISPPSRFVLMTLKFLNIEVEMKEVDLFGEQNRSVDYLKINPLHTVPTLTVGNFSITDSHAICTYLINNYAPNSQLYPQNPLDRAKVDRILYFNNGFLFARESVILRSPFHPTRPSYIIMIDKFTESLNFLEKFCQESKWLAGDEVTLADLSCIATYSSAELLVTIDKGKFPNIDKWVSNCEELSCCKLGNDPGLENLKKALLKYGNLDYIKNIRSISIIK